MKTYRHKVGELYKPYKGSHEQDGQFPLVLLLVNKGKTHYDFKCVGNEKEMIEIAGVCMTPNSQGFIRGEKIGKGRFYFEHPLSKTAFASVIEEEDFYECNLMPIKEN